MSNLDPAAVTLGAMLVAGIATSLHCAGMCGLLTCGLGLTGSGPALAATGLYHFCRLVAYGVAGAVAGGIGGLLGLEAGFAGVPWLPLFLVLFLGAVACGLDKKFGSLPFFSKAFQSVRLRAFRMPVPFRAAILGLATPLLPCGPLYAVFAVALASGSATRGSSLMLAFGLGALPAIWAVQAGSGWMARHLGAKGLGRAKQGLAALAAISLLWHFPAMTSFAAGDGDAGTTTCRCSEP